MKDEDEEEIWKKIPDNILPRNDRFYVSSFGKLKNEITGDLYVGDITKKGYHRVTVTNDGFKKRWTRHRLVLSAFNPIENMSKLEINHIDGDKSNNKLSNLEWSTGVKNVKHAFDTGLRNDNTSIIIRDIKENKEHKFRSINLAAKFLNTNTSAITTYVKRSKMFPLHGKYIIEIDDLKEGTIGHKYVIYSYDHVLDKYTDYIGGTLASIDMGISLSQILDMIKLHDTYYIAGYTISNKPLENVKRIDVIKAESDRKILYSRPLVKMCTGIKVYDTETDKTTGYASIVTFLKVIKEPLSKSRGISGVIVKASRKYGKPCLYGKYMITSICDNFDVGKGVYSDREIYLSKNNHTVITKLYMLNDEYIIGLKAVADKINSKTSTLQYLSVEKISERFGIDLKLITDNDKIESL